MAALAREENHLSASRRAESAEKRNKSNAHLTPLPSTLPPPPTTSLLTTSSIYACRLRLLLYRNTAIYTSSLVVKNVGIIASYRRANRQARRSNQARLKISISSNRTHRLLPTAYSSRARSVAAASVAATSKKKKNKQTARASCRARTATRLFTPAPPRLKHRVIQHILSYLASAPHQRLFARFVSVRKTTRCALLRRAASNVSRRHRGDAPLAARSCAHGDISCAHLAAKITSCASKHRHQAQNCGSKLPSWRGSHISSFERHGDA